MGIARCDGEVERVSAPSTIMRILRCRAAGRFADAPVSALGSRCRVMVSRRCGLDHEAFKIGAFHPLLELLKEFCPAAPLGPMV